MLNEFDTLILGGRIVDGSGDQSYLADLGITDDKIVAIGALSSAKATQRINASGLILAPGFIDVHTHDDLEVVRNPEMLAKTSQGVSTVVVGNCGISASPYASNNTPPDPINLLGHQREFAFSSLADYISHLETHKPAVNVIALVGHTSLRAQVMDDLSRPATPEECEHMRTMLAEALEQGAKGLSTGLAYHNAKNAPREEVEALAQELNRYGALYATHLRTEFDGIIDALDEAFSIGKQAATPVIISHLKCAGKRNWGRAKEILKHLTQAKEGQEVSCDCYPYHASSSTLDLAQVTSDFDIFITWSDPEPEMAGQTLAQISAQWQLSLEDTARRLMPAGARYNGMNEEDVDQFVQHPLSMIGSDGLPCDPHPHPRLWGTFPKIIARYYREKALFSLEQAIHKMTGLSAQNFRIEKRGLIKTGYFADLVLFDEQAIEDRATFAKPNQISSGVHSLWVNGQLAYSEKQGATKRARGLSGQFLKHSSKMTKEEEL